MKNFWEFKHPTNCEICGEVLIYEFVDAATKQGLKILCKCCHAQHGYGFGKGKGTHYIRNYRMMKYMRVPYVKVKLPKPMFDIQEDSIDLTPFDT